MPFCHLRRAKGTNVYNCIQIKTKILLCIRLNQVFKSNFFAYLAFNILYIAARS